MGKLENKTAIVTGAGSGMGRAIALLFAREGCKVLATDISKERLSELKEEAQGLAVNLEVLEADMSKDNDILNMFDEHIKRFSRLDILVNNAGVMDHFQPVGEVEDALLERVMKINFEGPFKAMRSACQLFLEQNSGNIINVSSIGGIKGGVAGAAYTSSKFALIGLSRNTGFMYAKSGIRCNVIAPGAVETNIAGTIDFSKITPLVQDRIMSGLVLNPRSGSSEEIAKAALFLASDDSSFVNGEVLVVDGGWTA